MQDLSRDRGELRSGIQRQPEDVRETRPGQADRILGLDKRVLVAGQLHLPPQELRLADEPDVEFPARRFDVAQRRIDGIAGDSFERFRPQHVEVGRLRVHRNTPECGLVSVCGGVPRPGGRADARTSARRAGRPRRREARRAGATRAARSRRREARRAGATRSRRARQHVNLIARRLGTPWIDAGVEGGSRLARITTYFPGEELPCLECGWSQQDYASLEQVYACDNGEVVTPSSAAPGPWSGVPE